MSLKYLIVNSDIEVSDYEAVPWINKGFAMDRVDDMAGAINKLLTNEYFYVGINSDVVDYMPLLELMRGTTHIPILIVTGCFTTEVEVAAMKYGADLFARWHKTPKGNMDSVLAHVAKISERKAVSRRLLMHNGVLLSPSYRSVYIGNTEIALTKQEFDLLNYLMINRGMALSYSQIYRRVWESEYDLSANSVINSTVKRLRKKLSLAETDNNVVQNIRGVGYRIAM